MTTTRALLVPLTLERQFPNIVFPQDVIEILIATTESTNPLFDQFENYCGVQMRFAFPSGYKMTLVKNSTEYDYQASITLPNMDAYHNRPDTEFSKYFWNGSTTNIQENPERLFQAIRSLWEYRK